MKMKDILWIKVIVQSTPTPPFLNNSRVDIVGFVNLTRQLLEKSAFLAFPNAQNEVELKGGVENERLKCQVLQMKGSLDLQEISKLVSIPNKKAQEKKSDCGGKTKMKKVKKLEKGSIVSNKLFF